MHIAAEPELEPLLSRARPAAAGAGAQREQEHERTLHRFERYRGSTGWVLLVVSFALGACEGRRAGPDPSKTVVPSAMPSAVVAPAPVAAAVAVPAVPEHVVTPPPAVACMARHYRGQAIQRDGQWWLQATGVAIPYDDGKEKTFDERLASPDIEDAFAERYHRGPLVPVVERDFDPGRARLIPLFDATYGDTEQAVRRALVPVRLVSHTVSVHERIAAALTRVATKLADLVREHPEFGDLFEPLGGGFNYRTVAGTELRSAHAYGIAVDLNPKLGAYWRWQKTWKNQVPAAIVAAFEDEGFIWGGRWFHFDTMHFEYRPEMLDDACYSH